MKNEQATWEKIQPDDIKQYRQKIFGFRLVCALLVCLARSMVRLDFEELRKLWQDNFRGNRLLAISTGVRQWDLYIAKRKIPPKETSEPYAIMRLGSGLMWATESEHGNMNPTWMNEAQIILYTKTGRINIVYQNPNKGLSIQVFRFWAGLDWILCPVYEGVREKTA